MNKKQLERMGKVNLLMLEISKYGRKFFASQSFVALKTTVRFKYQNTIVFAGEEFKRVGCCYGHGHTLSQLLNNFKQFILTGKKITTLNAEYWGYGQEEIKYLKKCAKSLGIMREVEK